MYLRPDKCCYGATHTQILKARPKKSGKILFFLNSPDDKSVLWSTTVINPNYNLAVFLRDFYGTKPFSVFLLATLFAFKDAKEKICLLKKRLTWPFEFTVVFQPFGETTAKNVAVWFFRSRSKLDCTSNETCKAVTQGWLKNVNSGMWMLISFKTVSKVGWAKDS